MDNAQTDSSRKECQAFRSVGNSKIDISLLRKVLLMKIHGYTHVYVSKYSPYNTYPISCII